VYSSIIIIIVRVLLCIFGMCLCSMHELIETSRYYMLHTFTTDIMERPEGTDPLKAPDPPLYYSLTQFWIPRFCNFCFMLRFFWCHNSSSNRHVISVPLYSDLRNKFKHTYRYTQSYLEHYRVNDLL
jgi:hypothetical protein